MPETPLPQCAICGRDRNFEVGWFLLVESRWQDKVKILQWHDQLAAEHGFHGVCCAAHVQQLVVHWMTTGSLEYPFARTKLGVAPSRGLVADTPSELDIRIGRQIGELAIHRESIQRILGESPHSLIAILDALLAALQDEEPREQGRIEKVAEEVLIGQGAL